MACGDWPSHSPQHLRRIISNLQIIIANAAATLAIMAYIHQLDDWPNFTWDDRPLAQPLGDIRHKQGQLLGRMEALGQDLRTEAQITALTSEVVQSCAIEGEDLPAPEVRSSLASGLGMGAAAGLPPPSRRVQGVVDVVLDATQNFAQPLTAQRLHGWHALLFPTGKSSRHRITVGAWRTDRLGPMQVVSGPIGSQRVHFQAPAAKLLPAQMQDFLAWFNAPAAREDPLLRASVAHLWFLTIHPFDDGNGRIARAIAEMALARADGSSQRYHSMSAAIMAQRPAYYAQLESAQRGSLHITAWHAWFLLCLGRSLDAAGAMQAAVLHKAHLWQRHGAHLSPRQRRVISRMVEPDWRGHLHTAKYAALAKCSPDTALRDIRALLRLGVLVKNPGRGRSTSYRLV